MFLFPAVASGIQLLATSVAFVVIWPAALVAVVVVLPLRSICFPSCSLIRVRVVCPIKGCDNVEGLHRYCDESQERIGRGSQRNNVVCFDVQLENVILTVDFCL